MIEHGLQPDKETCLLVLRLFELMPSSIIPRAKEFASQALALFPVRPPPPLSTTPFLLPLCELNFPFLSSFFLSFFPSVK